MKEKSQKQKRKMATLWESQFVNDANDNNTLLMMLMMLMNDVDATLCQ